MYFISLLFFPLLFPLSMKLPVRSPWTFKNACNWDNSLDFKCSDSKATFLSALSHRDHTGHSPKMMLQMSSLISSPAL